MPLFKGFKFSFNLSSRNGIQTDLSENNVSPVYVEGAYKVIGEQFYGSGGYGESPKKITPDMVRLPPAFQSDQTAPDVFKPSKSTGDLTASLNLQNLPPNLRKSSPQVSSDPRGETKNNRQSTDLRNTTDPKNNKKDQNKLDKKRLAEQKKQEKIQAQQRAKEESLRKQREKAELKEKAKEEKIRIQKEKAEAAKAKKEKKVPQKTRTNPLAQGPNAPLPYSTNTLQSSISKSSGPPAYKAEPNAIESSRESSSSSEVTQNENDGTGNTSFGRPIDSDNTWDLVAQHRAQISRAPAGGAANKVAIRLQEPSDPNATTGRKSLYV